MPTTTTRVCASPSLPARTEVSTAAGVGVLAAAPRESPDEVDLGALFAAAATAPPPPGASNDEAAVRDLLGKLEADNCVMVCEGTVFLV